MNKQWLPQNKNTLAIAIIAIAVVLVFGISRYNQKDISGEIKISQDKKESVATDTDGDGLKDWEENLWGTDINKADTDEDGISDFDEIKLNRSPVVYGSESVFKKVDKTDILNIENLTETDKVARTMFSQYLELKQTDSLTQENVGIIADNIAKASVNQNKYSNKYSKENFVLVQNDKKNLEKYWKDYDEITTTSKEIKNNPLVYVINAFSTTNIKEKDNNLSEVENIIDIYTEIEENLISINIPQEILSKHIDFVNNLHNISKSLNNLTKMEEDPVLAIGAIEPYQIAEENLNKANEDIYLFMVKNGII